MRRVLVLEKEEVGKQKTAFLPKTLVQKRKKEGKKEGQKTNKGSFSFVICYNCRGKEHSMKSYTSASRAMSKKIEMRAGPVDKGNQKVKIMNKGWFTKVVNTEKTPSPTPGPARKTPVPELRIVELVSNCDEGEAAMTKRIVEIVERNG